MPLSTPTIIRKPCCGKNCPSRNDPGEFGKYCSACGDGFCQICEDDAPCKNGSAHVFQTTTFLLSYAVRFVEGTDHPEVVGHHSGNMLGEMDAAIFPNTELGRTWAERFARMIRRDIKHRLESEEEKILAVLAKRAIKVAESTARQYHM